MLVRFPVGWERPVTGHYTCAEDVVFLRGEVTISGVAYGPGDWVNLPAGFTRAAMSSPQGALAFARFDGPARWFEEPGDPDARAMHERLGTGEPAAGASPLGAGTARRLRAGEPDSEWLCTPPTPGVSSPVTAELLDLRARAYAFVRAGEPLPIVDGPVFCRIFDLDTRGADR